MERKAKIRLLLPLLFLITIAQNQAFSFDDPKWVCVDPGHGGIYPGTMGWNEQGPPEKVHNLKACQVLDRVLFQSYEGEPPFQTYNYFVIHTRKDDSYFDEDLNEDLHIRAEIANGNRSGWYNLNFDFREGFPPTYNDPWWIEITQRADFFLSYHYDANLNYSIQRTDCYYYFDPATYNPNEDLTDENDRHDAAMHMVEQISAAVQNIYVQYPAEGLPFLFSTSAGSAINSDFKVLKDLDYTNIEKGGVLLEALFYTNYDAWRALNASDDPNWVVENIYKIGNQTSHYGYFCRQLRRLRRGHGGIRLRPL